MDYQKLIKERDRIQKDTEYGGKHVSSVREAFDKGFKDVIQYIGEDLFKLISELNFEILENSNFSQKKYNKISEKECFYYKTKREISKELNNLLFISAELFSRDYYIYNILSKILYFLPFISSEEIDKRTNPHFGRNGTKDLNIRTLVKLGKKHKEKEKIVLGSSQEVIKQSIENHIKNLEILERWAKIKNINI